MPYQFCPAISKLARTTGHPLASPTSALISPKPTPPITPSYRLLANAPVAKHTVTHRCKLGCHKVANAAEALGSSGHVRLARRRLGEVQASCRGHAVPFAQASQTPRCPYLLAHQLGMEQAERTLRHAGVAPCCTPHALAGLHCATRPGEPCICSSSYGTGLKLHVFVQLLKLVPRWR